MSRGNHSPLLKTNTPSTSDAAWCKHRRLLGCGLSITANTINSVLSEAMLWSITGQAHKPQLWLLMRRMKSCLSKPTPIDQKHGNHRLNPSAAPLPPHLQIPAVQRALCEAAGELLRARNHYNFSSRALDTNFVLQIRLAAALKLTFQKHKQVGGCAFR